MKKATQGQEQRKQRFLWITTGIIVIVLILFFLNRATEPDSTVELTPVGEAASVFIDRSRTSSLQPNSPTTYDISAGQHQILVAQDDHWPWTESFVSRSEETVTLSPFLVEQVGRRVVQAPSSITDALARKQGETAPQATNPVISPDGNIRVFIDSDTNIIAQWTAGTSSAPDYFNCDEGTCGVSVYDNQPVRSISFYPERSDVIFFATNNGVFAIEIDPTSNTQNFQPVVEGVSDPIFVLGDDQIFVSVGGRITVSDI